MEKTPTTLNKPVTDVPLIIDADTAELILAEPTAMVPEMDTPSTDLAIPATPLRITYSMSLPYQAWRWFADGTGVIVLTGALSILLSLGLVYYTVTGVMALLAVIDNVLSVGLTAVVAALVILFALSRGPKTRKLVVKGCPKGPTPGSHVIRVPR